MKFFISMLMLLSSNSIFAREGYEVADAMISNQGELCIIEEGVKSAGSLVNCSIDKREDKQLNKLNQKLEAFKKAKPVSLLQNFLDGRPLSQSGSYNFQINDFIAFVDSLEQSPSCQSGFSNFTKRDLEIKKKIKELNEQSESNEAALRSSCKINSSSDKSQTKKGQQ